MAGNSYPGTKERLFQAIDKMADPLILLEPSMAFCQFNYPLLSSKKEVQG